MSIASSVLKDQMGISKSIKHRRCLNHTQTSSLPSLPHRRTLHQLNHSITILPFETILVQDEFLLSILF